MKEYIDTIPLHEAFDSGDECPFCYLERLSEQRAIRYCIGPGASYMEPDFRAETDRFGFCRQHMKKLHDYGNALGNALILQTYLAGVLKELEEQADSFAVPPKPSLFRGKMEDPALLSWVKEKESTCFLCQRREYNMNRYFHTFFVLVREPEFRQKVDLDHFVGMFDYRQSGSDWKNSRDAVSRTMQKLRGAYPADPPYKQDP